MIRLSLVPVVLALVLLSACGGEEAPDFPVDPGLLGPADVDSLLGISIQPPFQFQKAGLSYIEAARQALELAPGSDGPYFTFPRAIFAIPQTEARVFVGEFAGKAAGGTTAAGEEAEWKDGYLDAARAKAGTAEIEVREFDLAGRPAIFLRIDNRVLRNDRVVFATPSGHRVQIDFVIPRELLEELGAGVASSIGSIRTF